MTTLTLYICFVTIYNGDSSNLLLTSFLLITNPALVHSSHLLLVVIMLVHFTSGHMVSGLHTSGNGAT